MAGAQVWPSNAVRYGLADDSANGFYAASATSTISRETTLGRDHVGDEVVMAMYNEGVTFSLSGITAAAGTTSANIATALTTANSDMYGTDYDGAPGTIYVQTVELTRSNTGFETGSVTAIGRVGISGAGSAVT